MIGKQIKNVLLIGGGRISKYLAPQLNGNGYKHKIIEKSLSICEDLSEMFPRTEIIHEDATDTDIIDEESINKSDACVVMTENDQANLIISMFAKIRGVEKVISKIISPTYVNLSENSGVDSNITPQYLITTKVRKFL